MKKLISLTVSALMLAAFAGAQTAKKAPAPTSIACAVMPSNKVDIAKATKNKMYADYKGKRYFFCCGGCPDAFKANPAKFAKSASIPTPKATK
jgi:YHS domain-containing protein